MRLVHPLPHWMYQVFTQGLASLGRAMDDLVFPWSCLLCGTEGGELHGPFCNSCRASSAEHCSYGQCNVLPPLCFTCRPAC